MQQEVMTLFEGQVPDDREAALRDAFIENTSGPLPEGVHEMRLLRSPNVPGQWGIVTRWRDPQLLAAYREAADPPIEVLAFRGADIEPVETEYEVITAEA
jgi:quinol monooxygenase YgiN